MLTKPSLRDIWKAKNLWLSRVFGSRCYGNIDFAKKGLSTNFNSKPVPGENAIPIPQIKGYFKWLKILKKMCRAPLFPMECGDNL